MPVIEYQRLDDVRLVPNVCVAAREAVRSVVLVTKLDDLNSVRTVALDESSRTSAALVRVIFQEFLGLKPEWISSSPNLGHMLEQNDAALLIGDPAMTFDRTGLNVFDVAGLWRNYTGLGFVFAMWMFRADGSTDPGAVNFAAACDEGLMKREEIIDFYQPLLDLPRADLHAYLYDNITFSLDKELRAGLNLYYQLAHKHGLIPALKPLIL